MSLRLFASLTLLILSGFAWLVNKWLTVLFLAIVVALNVPVEED